MIGFRYPLCGHCSTGGCHLLCHPPVSSLSSLLVPPGPPAPPDHWLPSILRQHESWIQLHETYYQWIMSRHKWWTESREIPLCPECRISYPDLIPEASLSQGSAYMSLPLYAASLHRDNCFNKLRAKTVLILVRNTCKKQTVKSASFIKIIHMDE